MTGNDEILFLDGYDEALVGISARFGQEEVACYDYNAIILSLVREGCSYEEAVEYFHFNIIGAWAGDLTPSFIACQSREDEG